MKTCSIRVKLVILLCLTTLVSISAPASASALPSEIAEETLAESSSDSDWYMAGANPQRTSWVSEEVGGRLHPEWHLPLEPYISQKVQVIAANGLLYISTAQGLYALHADTGQIQWSYATELPLGHSPTVHNGTVYVGGLDRKIHAIDALTGTGIWTFEGQRGFQTNPVIAGDKLYAGNRDGSFYAIFISGPDTGKLAWKYTTGGPILFSAAYKDNVVYFASKDMYAYALNATSGALVWRSEKFPGVGFHSWWPVIYSDAGTGRDYVIFSGSWGYRLGIPPFETNPNHMEQEAWSQCWDPDPEVRKSKCSKGTLIGTEGTEAGNWPAGTPTYDATDVARYFEEKPWRRTYFVVDAATGQEYTYNYTRKNGSTGTGYAPILWHAAKSGTRYPPLVGYDNVLYQPNKYLFDVWIPGGGVTGWKFGTTHLSRPTNSWVAGDEPLAISGGGRIIYHRKCCDRSAGSFHLETDEQSSYFTEGGNSFVYQRLPELYDQHQWEYAYWKHGDQNPPIPYRGRVYMIINNAVVAFSANGIDRQVDWQPGSDTGIDAAETEKAISVAGINLKLASTGSTWPELYQQETYYSTSSDRNPTPRFFSHGRIQAQIGDAPVSARVEEHTNAATVITTSFGDNKTLKINISPSTPALLLENTGDLLHLSGRFEAFAYVDQNRNPRTISGSGQRSGTDMGESWLMAWESTENHRWAPLLLSLQRKPTQIELSATGLTFSFASQAGHISVLPFYGLRAPKPDENTAWKLALPEAVVNQARLLNRIMKYFPLSFTEEVTIDQLTDNVNLIYHYSYMDLQDEWNTDGLRLGYIPANLALASWNGSPIRINGNPLEQHLDLNYLTPLGRFAGVPNSQTIEVTLPGLASYWRQPYETSAAYNADDPINQELVEQIQKILDAGHLRPGYGMTGIWGTFAKNRIGSDAADYWHTPFDTIYTLIHALPLLPPNLQEATKSYLQQEFSRNPPHSIASVGWRDGASREFFDLPPEVDAARNSYGPGNNASGSSWRLPPQNFYALWMYAELFGDVAPFDRARDKLSTPVFDTSMPYRLNTYIAGYVGYLRLISVAGEPVPGDVERELIRLFVLRAALSKNQESLDQTGFEYKGHRWSVHHYNPQKGYLLFKPNMAGSNWSQLPLYGFARDPRYNAAGKGQGGDYAFGIDFVNLVPEVGHFLRDYAEAEVASAVNSYKQRAPYWFVSNAEEGPGEGVFMPLYDVISLFQAKARILQEEREELEKYLDVPAVAIGDLFYIQNLVAILEAGKAQPRVATPTISPYGGRFQEPVTVELSAEPAGVSIHYTLDGSNPTPHSQLYTAPFTLDSSAAVKVRAYLDEHVPSYVANARFSIGEYSLFLPSIQR